jgi:small nuclear ribonucleoprotein (snRNP)-like protein
VLRAHFLCVRVVLLISHCHRGKLHSVDQYLNFKLTGSLFFRVVFAPVGPPLLLTSIVDIRVENEEKYPHLLSVTSIFIRGSVVRYALGEVAPPLSIITPCCRYVHLSKDDVELEILQATSPSFTRAPRRQSGFVLTASNRIQRARKLSAMPPKLQGRSDRRRAVLDYKHSKQTCFLANCIYLSEYMYFDVFYLITNAAISTFSMLHHQTEQCPSCKTDSASLVSETCRLSSQRCAVSSQNGAPIQISSAKMSSSGKSPT